MRTIIIVFFFTIYSISAYAQKISFDKIENDGLRHIGTEGLDIKLEDATYKFSLTVFSSPSSKSYCLLISSIWNMEEGCVLMIKLKNEEVVKLVANNINIGKVDWPKYNPIIGNSTTSGIMSTEKVDYYVSLFSLENDLLKKINDQGILKMRIAFRNKFFEKNWRKDELGKYIKKCQIQIEERLQKPHASNISIEAGF
jgi:hypothetical protein